MIVQFTLDRPAAVLDRRIGMDHSRPANRWTAFTLFCLVLPDPTFVLLGYSRLYFTSRSCRDPEPARRPPCCDRDVLRGPRHRPRPAFSSGPSGSAVLRGVAQPFTSFSTPAIARGCSISFVGKGFGFFKIQHPTRCTGVPWLGFALGSLFVGLVRICPWCSPPSPVPGVRGPPRIDTSSPSMWTGRNLDRLPDPHPASCSSGRLPIHAYGWRANRSPGGGGGGVGGPRTAGVPA